VAEARAPCAGAVARAASAKGKRFNPLMGQETFYGGGTHGYIDYPTLEQSRATTEPGELAPARRARRAPRLSLIGPLAP
jgi:hypothetical protein